jgi:hypothetical protein
MFYYDDIKRLFPRGTEFRCIALRDQLIDCRLRIHCLAEGSLDPLVISVFEHLSKKPASVQTLTESLNGKGRPGVRTVAQTLIAMEQAGEVEITDDLADPVWSITETSCWRNDWAQEVILEGVFRYLPRSKDFGPYLPGSREQSLPKLVWWNNPAEVTGLSCSKEALLPRINEACSLYYSNTSTIPKLATKRPRSEPLQRSSLLSVRLRFLNAEIIDLGKPELWNVHRCVLGRAAGERGDIWKIMVARYPSGPRNYGYEQYFRRLEATNTDVFQDFIKAAISV